ncbi:MAG: winged helix-turn-helix transcriptional regulator [Phreatobacter sp.]
MRFLFFLQRRRNNGVQLRFLYGGETLKISLSECPIEDAIRVLGGRWRSLVVYYLKDGPKRLSDLRRGMPKISQRMLTLDLRALEAIGVLSRTVYSEVPPKVEYRLTDDGQALMPVIHALSGRWAGVARRRNAEAA